MEIFSHVLGAEHVWLSRIRGRAPELAVWPKLELERCGPLAKEDAAGYRALLEEGGAEALAREVSYVNSAGKRFTSRVGEIVSHAALHGHYHRGQVAVLLRAAGYAPSTTDFIEMVRGAPAAVRKGGG